mmetsp:Transcript_19035/g.38794  ORF Transcript_19035/g.38794 Transcript_19035/m.38794 type:complete len:131 (-) Transcript_19035:158-550(-)
MTPRPAMKLPVNPHGAGSRATRAVVALALVAALSWRCHVFVLPLARGLRPTRSRQSGRSPLAGSRMVTVRAQSTPEQERRVLSDEESRRNETIVAKIPGLGLDKLPVELQYVIEFGLIVLACAWLAKATS